MTLIHEGLTKRILNPAYAVHSHLGPGLLESAYTECLFFELLDVGLKVEKQKALPLIYRDIELKIGYRLDLLIEDEIIIEAKSVEGLLDIHTAQLLTYLKLSGCKVGFLINFNVKSLKSGIRRYVL